MVSLTIDHRKDRENPKGCPLFIRISYKGKKAYVATGITVMSSHFKDQKIRNRGDSRELNERIETQISILNSIINRLIRDNIELAPSYVKDLYIEQTSPKKSISNSDIKSLYNLMTAYVETGRGKKFQSLKKNTKRTIKDSLLITKTDKTHPNFGHFLSRKNLIEIKAESLTLERVKNYIIFLEEEGLSINTQAKRLKHLKSFLLTIKNQLTFSPLDIPVIGEVTGEIVHLSNSELQLIKNYAPGTELEQKTKDMFLFLCFTGFRIGDAFELEPSMIKTSPKGFQYISKIMEKTSKRVEPILEPEALEILARYNDRPPKLLEKDLREQIKIICKNAGINEVIEIIEYKHGKRNVSLVEKYTLISPHTGRKTRVMMLHERGIPLADIASQIGDTIQTMLKYYFKEDKEKSQIAVWESFKK